MEITRKIHFFHFKLMELKVSSSDFHEHSNPKSIFTDVLRLPFQDQQAKSRFMHLPNNDVLFLTEATVDSDVIKGKFAVSRRSALPELETGGVLSPLKIPRNSGLAEITHFIYYPNRNIIGAEFNFHGPRTTALKNYLIDKSKYSSKPVTHIELWPILNHDLELQLEDMGEIDFLEMELSKNDINVAKELDESLYNAFESASKVSTAEVVEIVLRKKKYSREGFTFPFSFQKVKKLFSDADSREKIYKMRGEAESNSEGEKKVFDLLEDKMIVSKKVTTLGERSRSVISESMFEKIEEAYTELRNNFQ